MYSRHTAQPDYNEEARILFRRLNLPEDGSGIVPGRYNNLDVIFQNKTTGAKVYVGNQSAARDAMLLRQHGISHIVNCQELNSDNYHEGQPGFYYKRFPISHWRRVIPEGAPDVQKGEVAAAYFGDVFAWVDDATAKGHSVLIHCLAGAHRAGTTGCAYIMHAARLPAVDAIRTAKTLRPAIDPIFDFPKLLGYFEVGMTTRAHRGY